MMDLTTTYVGLSLRNPLVASASPVTRNVAGIVRLAEAGAAAVVLPSLFEEQVARDADAHIRLLAAGTDSFAESLSYLPTLAAAVPSTAQYLHLVRRAAAAVDIPVIASLNGSTDGGWVEYAAAVAEAGARAIELNIFHLPGDPHTTGRDVEERHVEILTHVRAAVDLPIAVKLSPYFSSTADMALRLDRAGADGLVLFNRFMQPDVDPETLTVTTGIRLSYPEEGRLPRAWIALLRGRVRASLAATTGVETSADLVAYLLAGADVVMSASALLRHGPEHCAVLLNGLTNWMDRKGFSALAEVRGLLRVPDDEDFASAPRSAYLSAMREARHRYRSA